MYQLESVQRYFTKKIYFGEGITLDYWERLKTLKIYSAERRRERYIILYTWKVLHNIYPNPGLKINELFPDLHSQHPVHGLHIKSFNARTGITIGHIISPTISAEIKSRSVLNKCCELYNHLPAKLRRTVPADKDPELPKFKQSLDEWLATIPDQPTVPGKFRPAQSNSILHQKAYTI